MAVDCLKTVEIETEVAFETSLRPDTRGSKKKNEKIDPVSFSKSDTVTKR